MHDDPKHGVDYFIDYYAVLGLERSADADAIKQARNKLQLQYHPDRYDGLAAEFQGQAKEKSRIVEEGYKILSDPGKRAAYDAELAAWKGLVSTSGFPVVDPMRPHFTPLQLLEEETSGAGQGLLKQLSNQLLGYDPATFALIEKLYLGSENPAEDIIKAYKEQLAKKDLYLAFQEQFAWEAAGFHNEPIEDAPRTTYADEVKERLTRAAEKIDAGISRTLLLVANGEVRLLGPAGETLTQALTTDTSAALDEYRKKASLRFEAAAQKIREAAAARATIVQQRLAHLKASYPPPQEQFFPRLLIRLRAGDTFTWFLFALEGMRVVMDTPANADALAKMEVAELLAYATAHEENIVFAALEDGLDIKEQLTRIVEQHFDKLPEPQAAK